MLQHAPFYGVGLEDLSLKELDTLSNLHEEGLKAIHTLRGQVCGPCGDVHGNAPKRIDRLQPRPLQTMINARPVSDIHNGNEIQNQGHNISMKESAMNIIH
ncbi:Ubiquitin carboxyl-terminal hydrolase [Quillaja saponaria]|uniref:Ubiquitin carboxyl-terminal hydrolase n=1 Tax=Quillaja saponaria TaxID=32244 RepID=A0AAD7QCL3_QUISA|nr:Ubiquitin carboxyl-terminal hydrolase [Quillaja saponaria]